MLIILFKIKQMMATSSSTSPSLFLLLLLLFLVSSELYYYTSAISHSTTVKFLPGLPGPLPFHLETGYVRVGESSEDVELFYYFMKSEKNLKDDPLMLWLTGGPGCSALSGLTFEIGPFKFKMQEYNGSLPTLALNPHSWTKISSIIFVDLPANTGFSYAKPPIATQRSDSKQIQHAVQFIRKWLMDHPEFFSNSFYVGGDSYSGLIVPAIALEILKGNENSVKPSINYQGYILGNPITNFTEDQNYIIPFAHGMGLISDELYQSLKSSCGEKYQNVDPNNEMCVRDMAAFEKCVSGICVWHILDPQCPSLDLSPNSKDLFGRLRSLHETSQSSLMISQPSLPITECRFYGYVLVAYWANDDTVRRALGIRRGSIGQWERCLKTPYAKDIESSFPFHVELSTKGYRALVYSGDHDFVVPFLATQAWIRSLNYTIVDEWRPWLFQSQIAGYTRMYSNGMTFAIVKGAGHTAPEYKGKESFAMFERWISQKPLYVRVGELKEDVELFYYFMKSERNPKEDPLMLWLTGGPGCSALSSVAFEIGPFHFRVEAYNGSLPTLILNPYSWTKVSSIIFVDLPTNTGFSYSKPLIATQRSDSKQIQHALQFIRKWLIDHPEFLSNSFYVGGDSYAGMIVLGVALQILKGNEDSVKPLINYQGYILGNPITNITKDKNYKIPFAHGMGLISDELYQSLKSNCGGEYQDVDPNNKMCVKYVAAFEKCVSGLNEGHILEPLCVSSSPKPKELIFGRLRSLHETSQSSITSEPSNPPAECSDYVSVLATYWANDEMVWRALGIRQGSEKWERCIVTPYTYDIESSFPFHVELSTKGYRALVYSGDHDFEIPFCGTEAWTRSLNYSIVDEWRPWLFQSQIAGYTRLYSNGMTFATVKGAGHIALYQKPKECLAMFERWISQNPL